MELFIDLFLENDYVDQRGCSKNKFSNSMFSIFKSLQKNLE